MNIEHVALNVADPAKMADWYVKNLEMKIVNAYETPVVTRFIADAAGKMMVEIYHHPTQKLLDFPALHYLVAHLAFKTDDVKVTQDRLVKAGASVAMTANVTPSGDEFAMVRDPWGLCVQLVKRKKPLL